MIIWGSKGVEKQVGSGSFYCPACQTDSIYSQKRISRYFTLFFIPLFPTSTLGEYVTCGRCQNAFDPQILYIRREDLQAAVQPWLCPHCRNTNAAAEGQCLACGKPRPPGTPTPPPPLPPG